MTKLACAGAGFLLAVLWFDLMFDVQVLRRRRGDRDLPDPVLASIAGYYRRVTTAARPMNRLVAAVMVATTIALVVQITEGEDPAWVGWSSLLLAVSAFALAAVHTFPAAVRLGSRSDPIPEQSRLALAICRDHLLCLAAISALLVIQLGFAG